MPNLQVILGYSTTLSKSELETFSVNNNNLCQGSYPSCILTQEVESQVCSGCPPSFFMVDGYCAYESDYSVLQGFIDLNPESISDGLIPSKAYGANNPHWWEGGRLVEISFQHKSLTSIIPDNFSKLDSLKILRLTGNELYGNIPGELMNLKKLKILKLNSNEFSGSIPSNVGSLESIDTLLFNNNNLIGNIPTTIAELDGLQYLGLQENNLTGTIPYNIGEIDSLKYLMLDNNELSGEIPESIGDLSILRRLYLYNNNLSGQIPVDICTIYSINEDFRSYLDNNYLCPSSDGNYPICIPEDHLGPQIITGCNGE